MSNNTELFKLDLDNASFNKRVDESGQKLKELGDATKVKGLVENLEMGAKVIGVIGTVALAAKTALDFSLQAEQVRLVNAQFEILTRNAGISGEKLKESLVAISGGLVGEGDILKAASQGIVSLGNNAERLPEIFELARKASLAFGGDVLENFEKFNQAIASGQTRALKQYGLIVDNEKAIRDYAASLNTTVNALSEQEKRTAVLNAVLEKSKTAFEGIDGQTLKVTNSFERLKVKIDDLNESAAIAFDNTFGGVTQSVIEKTTSVISNMTRFLTAKFGDGPEAARAQLDRLREKMAESQENATELKERVEKLGASYGNVKNYMSDYVDAVRLLGAEEKRLSQLREEVATQQGLVGENEVKEAQNTASQVVAIDEVAIAKRAEVASKFASDLAALRMNRINGELEVAQTVEQVQALQEERQQTLYQMLLAREEQIKAAVQNRTLTEEQALLQLDEVRKASIAEMRKVEQRAEEERLKALQNLANASRFTTDGFANGFKAASASASRDFGNFAKMGESVFNSFSNNAAKAFLALGEGTQKASDVMKGFFLNALADIAEAQGKVMLANIYNPAGMAAGAGLLVLAGFLRSKAPQGGGESLGAETSGGGATGDSGAGVKMSGEDYGRPEVEEARRRREVQVIIQGNYLETPEVQRTLMEMIRNETDATGFSYTQIGQGA